MDLEMKNKLIGNYFKKEREYHDLKLSQVSKDINIPKTSLWEYERGLKNFESEKVNIFNLYYDTTFDCNELYYEESLQTLLAAYFYYSKFNIDKINNLYEESCRYIDTLGYSSYYLIRLIWKLVNEKMDDRDIDEMDNIKFLLSNKQKVIYYEIICGYYIKINNIKLARKYLSYIENYDDFDFFGMLDINKMLINKVQTKYIDALENYKNATQILVKYNNIIWLIFLNVQLGSIYLDTNYYKQAYEYFIEARKSAKEFHSDWLIKYTDYNIADYYLKVDEPEKAVKICKNYIEVENKKHTDLRLLYIFICGLFKLGRYSECVEYISQINRCKLNEEECIFFDLISKMSANYDPDALKEKCDIFIQRLTELSNAGDVNKFVLLISDYFFDHGEFKLAYEYLKKYNSIITII